MKTPPTPPDPIVAEVARILPTNSRTRKSRVGFPRRIRLFASKPLPQTSGRKIPSRPTIAPPIAIVAGSDSFVAAKSRLDSRSAQAKSAEQGPAARPITAKAASSNADRNEKGATW